jgi:hypothetical protein
MKNFITLLFLLISLSAFAQQQTSQEDRDLKRIALIVGGVGTYTSFDYDFPAGDPKETVEETYFGSGVNFALSYSRFFIQEHLGFTLEGGYMSFGIENPLDPDGNVLPIETSKRFVYGSAGLTVGVGVPEIQWTVARVGLLYDIGPKVQNQLSNSGNDSRIIVGSSVMLELARIKNISINATGSINFSKDIFNDEQSFNAFGSAGVAVGYVF